MYADLQMKLLKKLIGCVTFVACSSTYRQYACVAATAGARLKRRWRSRCRELCDRLATENLTVGLSGSGSAAFRELSCKSLAVSISGSGNTTMYGQAEQVTTRISGSGGIDAAGLKAARAEVRVSGSGTVSVWATDELKAHVSGSGDVSYTGNPKVDKKVSGSGKVRPRT